MFNQLREKGSLLIVIFVLILMFAMVGKGYCVTTDTVGDKNTSGIHRVEVKDGVFTFAADTGIEFPYQSGTTNDTLAAADSGRTYVISSGATSAVYLNLPAAVPGMVYPFINSSTEEVYINPDGTDIINYASLSAGDTIYNSSSAKGDSIKLICTVANTWDVEINNGTWQDGGQ